MQGLKFLIFRVVLAGARDKQEHTVVAVRPLGQIEGDVAQVLAARDLLQAHVKVVPNHLAQAGFVVGGEQSVLNLPELLTAEAHRLLSHAVRRETCWLLLNNENVRDVINTITTKAVLIRGRFTPERKAILDALRDELRKHDYVPILFDFDKPTDRDFTETIMTLAGMCRFIIADITNPKSAPLELQATVPNYMIPFVPIIQEDEQPFSMFQDIHGKFDWVLDTLTYQSQETLIAGLEQAVILPALEMHEELMARKQAKPKTRRIEDYLSLLNRHPTNF